MRIEVRNNTSDIIQRMRGYKMNEFLAIFVMCFAFLYLLEGIESVIKEKVNKIYKITHVLYPLYMFGVMLYFLATGMFE